MKEPTCGGWERLNVLQRWLKVEDERVVAAVGEKERWSRYDGWKRKIEPLQQQVEIKKYFRRSRRKLKMLLRNKV